MPYGVYDLSRNEGRVSVGITHDTASFAVASIKRWWGRVGSRRYSQAREILITETALYLPTDSGEEANMVPSAKF